MGGVLSLITNLLALTSLRVAVALAMRHVMARLLSVGGLLLAAYLFMPRDFAQVGVYLACLNLIWIVIFWRYEGAITAGQTPRAVQAAIRTCMVIALMNWMCVALVLALFVGFGVLSVPVACFFASGLVGRAALRLLMQIATREGKFPLLGRMVIIQAIFQPCVMLLLMLTPMSGASVMMLSDVVGTASAALFGWIALRAYVPRLAFIREEFFIILARWKALPLLNLPTALLAVGFSSLPILLTPLLADDAMAGSIALASRLLDMPTQLIGAVVTPILLHRLRDQRHTYKRVVSMALWGFAIAILVAFMLISLGFWVVSFWLEGTKWAAIGSIFPMLALFFAGLTIAGPLGEAAMSFRHQTPFFRMQLIMLILALAMCAISLSHVHGLLLIVGGISLIRAGAMLITVMRLYGRERS
jgi:hypothetical protein